jgi:hypothetical protein
MSRGLSGGWGHETISLRPDDDIKLGKILKKGGFRSQVGLVVYPGDEIVEIRKNVWGVPDRYLLGTLYLEGNTREKRGSRFQRSKKGSIIHER